MRFGHPQSELLPITVAFGCCRQLLGIIGLQQLLLLPDIADQCLPALEPRPDNLQALFQALALRSQQLQIVVLHLQAISIQSDVGRYGIGLHTGGG